MPLPALVGVSWLGGLIGSLFVALFGWFAKFFTRRLAIAAAMIATVGALTVGFWAAISALLGAVSSIGPPYLAQAASLVVPTNLPACLAALASARAIRWVYDMQVKVLLYTNAGSGY